LGHRVPLQALTRFNSRHVLNRAPGNRRPFTLVSVAVFIKQWKSLIESLQNTILLINELI
jgi:hypothetical protein